MTILEKIALALPAVESPARYMGGEANSVIKDHSKMLARMAFVFPDTYEIGMSNNGLRILYHVLNREPDLLCEVAFAPWDDMAAEMKKYDIPLRALTCRDSGMAKRPCRKRPDCRFGRPLDGEPRTGRRFL